MTTRPSYKFVHIARRSKDKRTVAGRIRRRPMRRAHPPEFFALAYPTYNLRGLVSAGRSVINK